MVVRFSAARSVRDWLVAAAVAALMAASSPAAAQSSVSGDADADEAINGDQQELLMQRYEKMVQFNLNHEHALPSAVVDSLMTSLAPLEVGARIAAWADYFWRRGDATYLFGLDPQGYVTAGRLVDDCHTDCVLFFYRTTELGRSSNAIEAVQFAFGTRFHGGKIMSVVDDEGRVDYNSPVHLDYSLDILRSGIWGRDVTDTLGAAVIDEAGTRRYPAGSVRFVPRAALEWGRFADGDIVYFVTDEQTETGRKIRDTGAMIGHLGIVKVEAGEVFLIHAASKGLAGLYEGGRVAKVPLRTYLERVETFKGIMATRIESF